MLLAVKTLNVSVAFQAVIQENSIAFYVTEWQIHFSTPYLWAETFYLKVSVIDIMPYFQVARTQFKPVWPASGRDFCNFVVLRELAEGVFCQAYEAVCMAILNVSRR